MTGLAQRSRVLVAVDFDGTLAPLQNDPSRSRSVPGGIEVLRAAAALPGVWVSLVSGRDLETLVTLTGVTRDDRIVLIGSHGAQTSLAADLTESLLNAAQRALLEVVTTRLESIADHRAGARVELKPTAAVLHTRGMEAQTAAEAAAEAETVGERHTGVHTMKGHDVVELSVVSTSKGDAIRHLRGSVRAEVVAYFGDDVTDERAFEVLDWINGDVGVKVGQGETVAGHRVDGPSEVVEALELFVGARAHKS
jgi:trehalose-phosphatase